MSFSAGLVVVLVSIGASIWASLVVVALLEHWLSISVALLRLASRSLPESERFDFEQEALGNLGRLEGAPLRSIAHAVGFVSAAVGIRRQIRRDAPEAGVARPKGLVRRTFRRLIGADRQARQLVETMELTAKALQELQEIEKLVEIQKSLQVPPIEGNRLWSSALDVAGAPIHPPHDPGQE